MRDEFLKIRVSADEREAWQRSADLAGTSLSAYIRRCVDEAQALEHALESEVESVRQARRHREPERVPPERPRPRPSQPQHRPHRVTIGEALARAEQNAGRGGPLL